MERRSIQVACVVFVCPMQSILEIDSVGRISSSIMHHQLLISGFLLTSSNEPNYAGCIITRREYLIVLMTSFVDSRKSLLDKYLLLTISLKNNIAIYNRSYELFFQVEHKYLILHKNDTLLNICLQGIINLEYFCA